ncbi:hypothetical protein VULLAG_LOCUS1665 [Vulpes lagopus]
MQPGQQGAAPGLSATPHAAAGRLAGGALGKCRLPGDPAPGPWSGSACGGEGSFLTTRAPQRASVRSWDGFALFAAGTTSTTFLTTQKSHTQTAPRHTRTCGYGRRKVLSSSNASKTLP